MVRQQVTPHKVCYLCRSFVELTIQTLILYKIELNNIEENLGVRLVHCRKKHREFSQYVEAFMRPPL